MSSRKRNNGASGEPGTLIIIGGHEDKEGDALILRALCEASSEGALVVVTAASNLPDEVWDKYRRIFRDLGVKDVRHLHIDKREEAFADGHAGLFDGASSMFFTGGDQLKLTSQLGDTPIYSWTREIYERGGCIAGTSAGASVVCETMLVSGDSSLSPRIADSLRMAPGFGFIPGVIIDQHFAERGRIGRLIGAVSQNPRILGIGIDENTAIVCEGHRRFRVIGEGGVYVLDGRGVSHSNIVEEARDSTLSVFDLRLHLLNMGDEFDLTERVPSCNPKVDALEELGIDPKELSESHR